MASKYGKKASEKVEQALHEMKRGKLKSSSGRKVTSRKQAIAIGLSQARRAGGKVPPAPRHATVKQGSREIADGDLFLHYASGELFVARGPSFDAQVIVYRRAVGPSGRDWLLKRTAAGIWRDESGHQYAPLEK